MIGIILVGATFRNAPLVLPDRTEGRVVDKHAPWDFSEEKEPGKAKYLLARGGDNGATPAPTTPTPCVCPPTPPGGSTGNPKGGIACGSDCTKQICYYDCPLPQYRACITEHETVHLNDPDSIRSGGWSANTSQQKQYEAECAAHTKSSQCLYQAYTAENQNGTIKNYLLEEAKASLKAAQDNCAHAGLPVPTPFPDPPPDPSP
jgi:hypothetical protein